MTAGYLSKAGAAFSAGHEAIFLFAYADPGTGREPWTIGIGHTDAAGAPMVKRGDRLRDIAHAFEIYAADMGNVERDVRRGVKVELAQHEFDAAASFHLNTGALISGSVDDKLNRGDRAAAFTTWGAYINAGGKPMDGLRRRRREEIELFRTGRYPAARILVKDTATGSGRYISADSIPWRTAPAAAAPVVIEVDRVAPVKIVKSPVKSAIAAPVRAPAAVVKPWYTRAAEWLLTG